MNQPKQTAIDIWIKAWCAVASATNCIEPESAERWADKALNAAKSRFAIMLEEIDPSLHQMD